MNTTFVRPLVEGVKTSFLFLWAAVGGGGGELVIFSSIFQVHLKWHMYFTDYLLMEAYFKKNYDIIW